MYLQQGVKIKLKNIHLNIVLLYLQHSITIINRNLLRNESLASEKLCTVVFGRGRLKITMKRYDTKLAACANITQATHACAVQNLRPRDGD